MKSLGDDGKEPCSIRDLEAVDCDGVLDRHLEIMRSVRLDRPVMREFDLAAVVPLTEEQREFVRSTLDGVKVAGGAAELKKS